MVIYSKKLLLLLFLALPLHAFEFAVPLMSKPPEIDGFIQEGEWSLALGFDGFAWQGNLERRQVRAFLGATETHIYIAILSQLPAKGDLVKGVKKNTPKIVFDDSIEVWIDPNPNYPTGITFQMLANPLGYRAYIQHGRGEARAEPSWRGHWEIANGFHDGFWHCEIAIPIEEIAPQRKASQGIWGINICRNWKNPWQFSSLGGESYEPRNLLFRFLPTAPAISFRFLSDPHPGEIRSTLSLSNPTSQPMSLRASLRLVGDKSPQVEEEKSLSLAPGEKLEIPFTREDPLSNEFRLSISVAVSDGAPLYQREYKWQRGAKEWSWVAPETPPPPPIDLQFAYYPYLNKIRLLVDITGLPEKSKVKEIKASIREANTHKVIKTIPFRDFVEGREEREIILPPLEGRYEIVLKAEGENLPSGEVVKTFERRRFEWERNPAGRSRKVYPPFTPLKVQGKKVLAVLREHSMNDMGLWDQVIAESAETGVKKSVLSAPMRYRVFIQGREERLQAKPLRFSSLAPDQVIGEGEWKAGRLSARFKCTWDYDGMMRVDLTLLPTSQEVDSLFLEIPFTEETAQMLHAMADGIRGLIVTQRIPEGEGIVWDSTKVGVEDFPPNFATYIFVGNPVRGIAWFCENDRGWSWDETKPNAELIREGGGVILRIHFINKPLVIREPRTITFGLQCAPVKPRLSPWRHRWFRDKYHLLGTDINWFALGDCGSVYPAGKDMYLWEMLRKANKEQLSDEEIERVAERASKYFAPYGEDKVRAIIAHVRYNLRAHLGARMVFYYNRASYQAAEEFQTFQDEWGLDDYRRVGEGNGIWEIKIVPTESYIDHALYWYGKSFDIAGNQGVYWDNWFFVASYNTGMTSAYKRPDGSIVPSNGIWGLRELAKRTFQFMNERKMLPITMAHMTSTSILPLLSFCTVQYDWEWKYSEGDLQDRFPREYLLLVSNGELAGTWPVVLWDHGPLAEDPWTQRTFAGASLVHEIDPPTAEWTSVYKSVWEKLLKPIHALLDQKDLKVYRYWDERPQPIQTGDPDLPCIVYSLPGKEAVVVVTSYAREDRKAVLQVNPQALGFGGSYEVYDVESGERMPVENDRFAFQLKKHDVREFRLVAK